MFASLGLASLPLRLRVIRTQARPTSANPTGALKNDATALSNAMQQWFSQRCRTAAWQILNKSAKLSRINVPLYQCGTLCLAINTLAECNSTYRS
jgi:hypothetical protein